MLAQAANDMSGQLRGLITELQQAGLQITNSSTQVLATAEDHAARLGAAGGLDRAGDRDDGGADQHRETDRAERDVGRANRRRQRRRRARRL